MNPIDLFYDWFRAESEKLPPDTQASVLKALNFAQLEDPNMVFIALNILWEGKKLPASWGKVLTAFFWSFCC